MSDAVPKPSCARCGGTDLCHGALPETGWGRLQFKPDGNWFTGYPIRAYVCVACGTLGLRVDPETAQELRAKITGASGPRAAPDPAT
jgi:hypothetical protein